MLHIVRLIERRFPEQSGRIAPLLVLASLLALAVGLGLRFA